MVIRPDQDPKITLKERTKKKLDKVKIHPRETYDGIMTRLLVIFNKHIKRTEE